MTAYSGRSLRREISYAFSLANFRPFNSVVRSRLALNAIHPPQCKMTITKQTNQPLEQMTSESYPVKDLVRGEVRIEMLLSSGVIGIMIDSTYSGLSGIFSLSAPHFAHYSVVLLFCRLG